MFLASKHYFSKKVDNFLASLHMQAYSLIFMEILIGGMLSVFSFIFFIKVAKDVLEREKVFIDHFISHVIYSFRTPELTEIMRFFSFIGGEFIIFASLMLVIWMLVKGYLRDAVVLSFAISMGYALNTFIKWLLKIPRPMIDPLDIATFYSFPSGHSMNSFIFYAMISFFVFRYTRKKALSISVAVFATGIIFLVGFSRIYLGVHYPTDVIAGFTAGFWWFVTVIVLDKTLQFYRIFKERKINS